MTDGDLGLQWRGPSAAPKSSWSAVRGSRSMKMGSRSGTGGEGKQDRRRREARPAAMSDSGCGGTTGLAMHHAFILPIRPIKERLTWSSEAL